MTQTPTPPAPEASADAGVPVEEEFTARKIAGGAAWSTVGQIGNQLAQFSASVVLARILLPEQFGLIALVMVFSQFAVLFFDLGMGNALVQAKEVTEEDLATVFWINALGGVVFALLLAALGPVFALFFNEPVLVRLTPIVALSFTMNLGVCHFALLQRSLRFRAIAASEFASAVVGFAVSITLALAGWGVYALAVGPVVQQFTNSVIVWRMVPWRPASFVDRASARRVWIFSRGLLGFNVVNYWGRNADNLLIGRFSGPVSLGLYNRAYNFMLLPVQQIGQVLGRVMLPSMSRLQHDHQRAASLYRRSLQVSNALAVPALAGIAAVSPALVPVLWGDQWRPMIPLLALLCLAGVPQCLTTSVGWIYQSQNRTGTLFKMGLLTSGLGVVAMAVGTIWGAKGVALAVVARTWLFAYPVLAVAGRLIGLRALDVMRDNAGTLILSATMAALVYGLPLVSGLPNDTAPTLLLQVLVGLIVYGGGMAVFQRSLVRELSQRLRPQTG